MLVRVLIGKNPTWVGMGNVRKDYIELKYLPNLDFKVHRGGRHNYFG